MLLLFLLLPRFDHFAVRTDKRGAKDELGRLLREDPLPIQGLAAEKESGGAGLGPTGSGGDDGLEHLI